MQNLDFALDLLLLDGLEDFDHAFLVVDYVDAFKHLGIFATTNLAYHLVVFKHAPGYVDRVVVPVGAGHVGVDFGVHAGDARRAAGIVERHGRDGRMLGRCVLGVGPGASCCARRVEGWGGQAETGGTQKQARKQRD